MTDPETRLQEAIKQLRLARDDLALHPKWDGALATSEIQARGVLHYLEEEGEEMPDDPGSLLE